MNAEKKPFDITDAQDIKKIVKDLPPEQIVGCWTDDNDSESCSSEIFRLTVKEINEILDFPGVLTDTTLMEFFKHILSDRALENMAHWYTFGWYWLVLISDEDIKIENKHNQAGQEIFELIEAGINGPFFCQDDFEPYPENWFEYNGQAVQVTPDEIIELAEKIKAFRAKKQQNQG